MEKGDVIRTAEQLLVQRMKSGQVECSCGVVVDGQHSPDCALDIAWDDCFAEAKDLYYQDQMELQRILEEECAECEHKDSRESCCPTDCPYRKAEVQYHPNCV